MNVLYLDESGNHDLSYQAIDPRYPIFALGGVIVDRAYLRNVIEPQMRSFKLRHFGTDTVHLHTVDMIGGRGDYFFLGDRPRNLAFYAELNELLMRWEYTVIVCAFEKYRYLQSHAQPVDPYHYGLEIIIEQFCSDLGDT